VSDPETAAPDTAIEGRVLAVVASIVGERAVGMDDRWRTLGMDSLDLLTLVTTVEDEFGLRIPDQVAMRLQTAADVVALVSSMG
jgi:acyl carrier protein